MKSPTLTAARWALVGVLLLGGCRQAPVAVTPSAPAPTPTLSAPQTPVSTATAPAAPLTPTRDAPLPQVSLELTPWPTCFELLPGEALRAQAAEPVAGR